MPRLRISETRHCLWLAKSFLLPITPVFDEMNRIVALAYQKIRLLNVPSDSSSLSERRSQ
jgi:hypothetical protein